MDGKRSMLEQASGSAAELVRLPPAPPTGQSARAGVGSFMTAGGQALAEPSSAAVQAAAALMAEADAAEDDDALPTGAGWELLNVVSQTTAV